MTAVFCPECQSPLEDDGLEGLCPRCLANTALFLDETEEGALGPFGGFMLLKIAGRGGMGVVYQARQVSLDRLVALKVLAAPALAESEALRRFQAEARATARLRHPNIVALHEVGEIDSQAYLAMEWVEGETLAERLRREPPSAKESAAWIKTVAEAVHFAHEQGIVHRDLKPSNILMDRSGAPKLVDFGLAYWLEAPSEWTVTGQVMGSPSYMSPEQAAGRTSEVGPLSDVYGLGAVLYGLLCRRAPFEGASLMEVLEQARAAEPVAPRLVQPRVPRDLETITLKCLRKEPARRYPSAAALAEDLGRFLDGKPILARPAGPVEKAWRWCLRRPALSAALAAFIIASVGGVTGILTQWRRAERAREISDANAAEARSQRYMADVFAASAALNQGNLSLARDLLQAHAVSEPQVAPLEWRLLWAACRGEEIACFHGHPWIITALAFSPDGQTLASGGMNEGAVRLWNLPRRAEDGVLPGTGKGVWGLQFAPDGALWASGQEGHIHRYSWPKREALSSLPGSRLALSADGRFVAVYEGEPFYWSAAGKLSVHEIASKRLLLTLEKRAKNFAVSPNGAWLAISGPDLDSGGWRGIEILSLPSGELWRRLEVGDRDVLSLAFARQGRRLAASVDSTAAVWDLDAQPSAEPLSLKHAARVWDAQFSPDGKLLATASSDRRVRLWSLSDRTLWREWRGHEDEVWRVAFSLDGQTLASGGKDASVRLWEVKPRPLIRCSSWARPMLSPDGEVGLFLHDGRYRLQRVSNGEQWRQFSLMGAPLGFSGDGQSVIQLRAGDRLLYHGFWKQAGHDREVKLVSGPEPIDSSIQGLSGDGFALFASGRDGEIGIWRADNGQCLGRIKNALGGKAEMNEAALSAGGRYLAFTGIHDSTCQVFDLISGRQTTLRGHRDSIKCLAFSPDGRLLATGGVDGRLMLWNSETGREIVTLSGHLEEVSDVAFSSDGRLLASLGSGEGVRLWLVRAARQLAFLEQKEAGERLACLAEDRGLAITTRSEALYVFP